MHYINPHFTLIQTASEPSGMKPNLVDQTCELLK